MSRGQGLAFFASLVFCLAIPSAWAANTVTLPQGTFVLDEGWVDAVTTTAFDNNRKPQSLLLPIDRYEPGGGLQGTITAKPHVRYRFLVSQLYYGLTDALTLAVGVPLVTSTTIDPHLGWKSGDYQSSLGRAYSESDFWQWAQSMGQGKPGTFNGNSNTMSDMILGVRYRLPDYGFLQPLGLRAALGVQIALPTGKPQDPEQLVAAGTTVWDLNNYGDAELHLLFDRPFLWDGVPRLNLGLDAYYAWLRPREMVSPTGSKNPLLLTASPYIGKTYTLDPGDFAGGTVSIDAVPLVGPTWSTYISGHSLEKASTFPPLLTLIAGYTWLHVGQTGFASQSPMWTWDHEKVFMPGFKNTVRLGADLSLLRVGLPLQFYVRSANQEWVPGQNIRASNSLTLGARVILKFW